jgi:hypothetical protein
LAVYITVSMMRGYTNIISVDGLSFRCLIAKSNSCNFSQSRFTSLLMLFFLVIGGATFEYLRETKNSVFGSALFWFVPAGKMSECHGSFYILSNSVSHVIVTCDVVHVDWVIKKHREINYKYIG